MTAIRATTAEAEVLNARMQDPRTIPFLGRGTEGVVEFYRLQSLQRCGPGTPPQSYMAAATKGMV